MRCLTLLDQESRLRGSSLRPSAVISETRQRRNALATFIGYLRFCQNTPAYRHTMANQFRIMDWISERRMEMLAEGRPHWVPAEWDFWRAMRDCRDDLVKV